MRTPLLAGQQLTEVVDITITETATGVRGTSWLRAALALPPAPNGFTVAEFAAKVHALTGIDYCGLQHPPGGL